MKSRVCHSPLHLNTNRGPCLCSKTNSRFNCSSYAALSLIEPPLRLSLSSRAMEVAHELQNFTQPPQQTSDQHVGEHPGEHTGEREANQQYANRQRIHQNPINHPQSYYTRQGSPFGRRQRSPSCDYAIAEADNSFSAFVYSNFGKPSPSNSTSSKESVPNFHTTTTIVSLVSVFTALFLGLMVYCFSRRAPYS